jgi:SAM-dependent methyltransferase
MTTSYVQQNQPPGVPPLALTGERTLPDVPEENYWYRRHLVVYRWIAERAHGLRVADMACGKGYGAAVLARRAGEVVAVDANPEAHEHARLKYSGPNLTFRRDLVERFDDGAPFDAITFLQTIEHVESPGEVLERLASLLAPGGVLYVSTPNRLTLAPPGEPRSDNPWHVREYDPEEFRALLSARFDAFDLLGVFHARKLALHAVALRLGWDRIHPRLGLSERFYGRFVPSISERDFAVRNGPLERALDLVGMCRR